MIFADFRCNFNSILFDVGFGSGACSSKGLINHSAPKITQWMETYMLEMGLDAHLHCSTNGPHGTMWIGPDENPILDEDRDGKFKIFPDGSLAIHDLNFEDMGVYQCIVKNKFGHDMAETFVYPMAVML